MTTEEIKKIIARTAAKTFEVEVPDFEVSYPEEKFGDFSSNIAFKLAKPLSRAPQEIASELANQIKHADIKKVEMAGPGFINLTMVDNYWLKKLANLESNLSRKLVNKPQRVQVEFISANPTGPLTLANARGGYLGDVLASVLSQVGHDTTSEYYINDAGGQVEHLANAIKAESGQAIEGERQYTGEYVAELAAKLKSELGKDDLGWRAVAEIIELIKATADRMGISFDVWFSEQSLIDRELTKKVIDVFDQKGLIYKKDGATWLKTTEFGDNRDRVLVKSSGEYVYLVNDYAYHYEIFTDRKFDRAIKIWGADHAGQVESLKLGVKQLIPSSQLDFILLQMVRIIKDGKEFKSSKRAGNFITVDELLDEVGNSDVVRFFFLLHSSDSQMDFDIDLAREHSQQNPLYYVMYSYARANSILEKASQNNLKPVGRLDKPNNHERNLIKQLDKFQELLLQVANSYEVHKLSFYGHETARLFHAYYESEKIIELDNPIAAGKLGLINSYKLFMEQYFKLIGITAQAKMDSRSD
ncbi:arginine--tRNA ligase [Candidatus Saccharibacteria bacterium]|nr:arginine--tRNA ligase [Candidatus Saccharibacteria bacterium]